MFPPSDEFNAALDSVCQSKGIEQHFKHTLTSIDKDNRVATFTTADGSTVQHDYDFMHIVPPQSSPDFVASSELAHETGWLDVDISTLQHKRFSNVFGLGDVCNLPTSKTAAAIFSQTPVLVNNILKELGEAEKFATYDGYAACPVFVGDQKLVLCEFKYGRKTSTSFKADQTQPSRMFYHLKKNVFPFVYWNLLPRGRWFGATGGLIKPNY